MDDMRAQGFQVFRELMPGVLPDEDVNPSQGEFGEDLLEIGIENVFGSLWGRDGLSRRDRSLVTMGILIALRATDEFAHHVARQHVAPLSQHRSQRISRLSAVFRQSVS